MSEPRYGRSTRQADPTRISTWSAPAAAAAGQVVRPLELAHAEKEHVLNRALDEYCQLQEQGSKVSPSQFCDRYPSYRHSLRRLIDVQDVLEGVEIDEFDWPPVGAEFMGFHLLGELGAGAIARVYLAIQPELGGRFVALKVSHGRGDEANTLGKLSHPYVVPVYSVAYDPQSQLNVVCMPYQGSATLADVLDLAFVSKRPPRLADVILEAGRRREEFVPTKSSDKKQRAVHPVLMRGSYVDGVALLGQQIAEALAYTHAQKILHRDLKPSNVLLRPDGVPMLLDFNLSIDLSTEQTRVGGTLPYMPPEQIRDVHVQPFHKDRLDDPRSDLFSLGVILYELLTGRLPFGDPPSQIPPREAAEAYLAKQQQPPTPLRQLNPAVDRHLATLVHRCLELDVQLRPASAQELVDSLRQHFSMLRSAKRWSRRHFLVSSAAALG
ncbi:MAG TPA: serine/threonine-protein kinase, partial [Nitrospiraceae bacterium]|nr:serine/threonine-protein kinase [Nitrospiraceae bacterium]